MHIPGKIKTIKYTYNMIYKKWSTDIIIRQLVPIMLIISKIRLLPFQSLPTSYYYNIMLLQVVG